MANVRNTQDVVEVAGIIRSNVQETQNIVEVATKVAINVRNTQDIVEIATKILISINVTQNIVELAIKRGNVTGLYFINPQKISKTDNYYEVGDTKIPNPVIRTALFGE